MSVHTKLPDLSIGGLNENGFYSFKSPLVWYGSWYRVVYIIYNICGICGMKYLMSHGQSSIFWPFGMEWTWNEVSLTHFNIIKYIDIVIYGLFIKKIFSIPRSNSPGPGLQNWAPAQKIKANLIFFRCIVFLTSNSPRKFSLWVSSCLLKKQLIRSFYKVSQHFIMV